MDIESRVGAGPYAAMMRRDWQAAADAFGELGWDYDRALMLSLLDDEELRWPRRSRSPAGSAPSR